MRAWIARATSDSIVIVPISDHRPVDMLEEEYWHRSEVCHRPILWQPTEAQKRNLGFVEAGKMAIAAVPVSKDASLRNCFAYSSPDWQPRVLSLRPLVVPDSAIANSLQRLRD